MDRAVVVASSCHGTCGNHVAAAGHDSNSHKKHKDEEPDLRGSSSFSFFVCLFVFFVATSSSTRTCSKNKKQQTCTAGQPVAGTKRTNH